MSFQPPRVFRIKLIAGFFALAFAISWCAWLTTYLLDLKTLSGAGLWLNVVAVLAPHVAALVFTLRKGGAKALRTFYARVFRRPPVLLLLAAVTLPLLLNLSRDLLVLALGLPHEAFFHPAQRTIGLLLFGQTVVVIGEEPGWRGFALPHLLQRFGAIPATLLLGVLWSAWHVPLFLIPGTPQFGTSFLLFLVLLIAWSMIVSWLVLASRSALVAVLFHFSSNVCDFTMWEAENSPLIYLAPWLIAGGVAMWLLLHLSVPPAFAGRDEGRA